MKPIAESCIQNRDPILKIIKPLFANSKKLLEIGSGTGQHAVYFAAEMPHLLWQTSDLKENHPGIRLWLEEAQLKNIKPPITLAACDKPAWQQLSNYDAIFSANTVHIMSKHDVTCLFAGIGSILQLQGVFALYGPFNYNGNYTSDSNARFDTWLKNRNPKSGIRDFEWLDTQANKAGMKLIQDHAMPANNRILVWQKTEASQE